MILISDQKGDQILNDLIIEEIKRISNTQSKDNLFFFVILINSFGFKLLILSIIF